jgi:hypothetical protein
MDLETRTINNKMSPFVISIYDGEFKRSFYLADYNSVQEMLIAASATSYKC